MTKRLVIIAAVAQALVASACVVRHPPADAEPSIPPTLAVAEFDSAWSVIYHTHFDTTFNGVNWRAARDELRPRAERARSADDVRGAIRDLMGRLRESHFDLFPREIVTAEADSMIAGVGQPGLTLRLLGGAVVVEEVDADGGAAAAGVQPGWVVRRIGRYVVDDSVAAFGKSPFRTFPGVTPELLALAAFYGPTGTSVRVEFSDAAGATVSRDIVRARQEGVPVKFGNLPVMISRLTSRRIAARIGVIWFNSWMVPLVPEFDRALDGLRDADGIVIDLRDNPGGYAPTISGIAGHFFDERTTLGTFRYRASESKTIANPRVVTADGRRVRPFDGPVAIITGPRTGSASEVFAGGMQSVGRARVFGERSFGAVLPATTTELPGGDILYHAQADFVTATGTRLEGRGVIPDVVAVPTRTSLLAGRDLALEQATHWIAQQREHAGPGRR